MKCPFCRSEDLKVIDSRNSPESNTIKRRRECASCQKRFTTFETIELTIQVHKRDGRYEDFNQKKLIDGLQSACSHTTISREQVIALASTVTEELMKQQVREIETHEIGEMIMKHLQALDPIAYIRFACVYKRFKDIDELVEAIQSVHAQ